MSNPLPPGFGLERNQTGHIEHVHQPYNEGGPLPGVVIVNNDTGRPISLMTAEQVEALNRCFKVLRAAFQQRLGTFKRTWHLVKRVMDYPVAPPPRTRSGMTARQYRAARRRYRRELTAWNRNYFGHAAGALGRRSR